MERCLDRKCEISGPVGWPASERGGKPSGRGRKEDRVQEEAEVTAGALTGGLLGDWLHSLTFEKAHGQG